jgi:hypothetical protein
MNLSLNGFFDGTGAHYTALIPTSRYTPVFMPNRNIFEFEINN